METLFWFFVGLDSLLIIIAVVLAVKCFKIQKQSKLTEGDHWNVKGTLHILKDADGTYMQLELDNNHTLSEIEQNNQVIFFVKVHDETSR